MSNELDTSLRLIQVYRDAAHRYFLTRSSATYLNAAAAGAITIALGHDLLSVRANCFSSYLSSHSVIYFLGCVLIFMFAAAATSIVNALSNSIYRYLAIAIDIEVRTFGINYSAVSHTAFGVTTEFVPDLLGELTVKFSGNAWNIINAAVMCYAAVLMSELGFLMSNRSAGYLIFGVGFAIYAGIVVALVDLAILPSEKFKISLSRRILKQWRSSIAVLCFMLVFGIQNLYIDSAISGRDCDSDGLSPELSTSLMTY